MKEIIWHEGWPPQQGWYDCLVDGEEMRMRYWICIMKRRPEWVYPNGDYERNLKVLWTGSASATEW